MKQMIDIQTLLANRKEHIPLRFEGGFETHLRDRGVSVECNNNKNESTAWRSFPKARETRVNILERSHVPCADETLGHSNPAGCPWSETPHCVYTYISICIYILRRVAPVQVTTDSTIVV